MKKHAGAYLEGCIASELKLGWGVGRIQVCVRVVPACDRCGADIVHVEIRADNLQGLLPAPGAMAVLEEQSTQEPQVRAAGAPPRPNEAPHPCLVEEADFIAAPRPGLTPDDLTRGREVGEGLQGFQPKKFRWKKSKERPLSGDRSFNPCLTAYDHTRVKVSLQTTYSNRLKRAMLPWPWELTVAQAAMARLHRLWCRAFASTPSHG